MKSASVSYTKNHLSELLARVKKGQSLIITDRGRPVARLEAVPETDDTRIARLQRDGILIPPKKKMDVKMLLTLPIGRLKPGAKTLTQTLIEEREEGDR